jgi:hypothetical protein
MSRKPILHPVCSVLQINAFRVTTVTLAYCLLTDKQKITKVHSKIKKPPPVALSW